LEKRFKTQEKLMKTLVIAHKSPFPVIDGGCFAMNVFLKNLQAIEKISQIDYLILSTHKHPFEKEDIPKEITKKVVFHRAIIDTKLYALSALKHLIQGKSYNLSRFYDKTVVVKLEALIQQNKYEYIFFESLFTLVYLKDIRKISLATCVLRAHNIEFEIWDSLRFNENRKLKKWYLSQLVQTLKKEEITHFGNLDLILSLSNDDIQAIEKISSTPTRFIPVSIEKTKCKTDYSNASFCFIGAFNWEPNLEAMNWFLNDLNPLIQQSISIRTEIAGKNSKKINYTKNDSKVGFMGFVKSSSEFLQSNGIFIAPLKSGSGVKIKVLEAMSNGLPCVLTPKAAEGLNLPKEYPICENSEAFISECIELAQNEHKRAYLGKLGYEFIQSQFTFESVVNELTEILN